MTEDSRHPSVEDIVVPATDGWPLAATLFRPQPAVDRRCVVQIHSATAVERRIYTKYGQFLARHGLTAISFDYRGIGDSLAGRDLRSFDGRMRHWGERDIAGVIDWVAEHYPDHRHRAVAHSVGGQVLGLAPNIERLDAIWAVAAQWGSWTVWPVPRRYLVKGLSTVTPMLIAAFGYFPGGLLGMGDLPATIGRDWMRWCGSRHYIVDDAGAPLRPHYDRLRARVRWLGFTDDPVFGPPAAIREIAERYPEADSEVVIVDPASVGARSIGHFGFFRSRFEDTLWNHSLEWLLADDYTT